MLGRLGGAVGAEIFSMNISLARFGGDGGFDPGSILEPNGAVWDDIAEDCRAWFGSSLPGMEIHPSAVLTGIKVADIGADGRYRNPPIERSLNQAGVAGGGRLPNQCAVAVTFGTDGDLGRVKGRIYAPIPGVTLEADGRLPESVAEGMEAVSLQLIENINNQPGIDVLDIRACVASQGRRNKDGSVRRGPALDPIVRVSVGRVVDTIRSRRNALVESKDWSTVADPA